MTLTALGSRDLLRFASTPPPVSDGGDSSFVKTPYAVLGVICALATGVAIGRHLAPPRIITSSTAASSRVPATGRESGSLPQRRHAESAAPSATGTIATRADRLAALRLTLGGATAREFARTAGGLLRRAPSVERDAALVILYEVWGRREAAAALASATQQAGGLRAIARAAVVEGWTTTDPMRAVGWVAEQGTVDEQAAACRALAELAPERVLAAAEGVSAAHGRLRREIFAAAAEAAVRVAGYEGARELVDRIVDADARAAVTARLADQWARHAPREAAAWITSGAGGPPPGSTVGNVATLWAAQDAPAAAEFALTLPAGATREAMLTAVVVYWGSKDVVAASQWLDRLDPHPDNDPAIAAVATDRRVVARNPEVALSWAESLAGEGARRDAIRLIVDAWAVRDRDAAARYLRQTSVLSPEVRNQLLGSLGRTPRSD